jgi:hypothetical protein
VLPKLALISIVRVPGGITRKGLNPPTKLK